MRTGRWQKIFLFVFVAWGVICAWLALENAEKRKNIVMCYSMYEELRKEIPSHMSEKFSASIGRVPFDVCTPEQTRFSAKAFLPEARVDQIYTSLASQYVSSGRSRQDSDDAIFAGLKAWLIPSVLVYGLASVAAWYSRRSKTS